MFCCHVLQRAAREDEDAEPGPMHVVLNIGGRGSTVRGGGVRGVRADGGMVVGDQLQSGRVRSLPARFCDES